MQIYKCVVVCSIHTVLLGPARAVVDCTHWVVTVKCVHMYIVSQQGGLTGYAKFVPKVPSAVKFH